jgi:hypothetical protein
MVYCVGHRLRILVVLTSIPCRVKCFQANKHRLLPNPFLFSLLRKWQNWHNWLSRFHSYLTVNHYTIIGEANQQARNWKCIPWMRLPCIKHSVCKLVFFSTWSVFLFSFVFLYSSVNAARSQRCVSLLCQSQSSQQVVLSCFWFGFTVSFYNVLDQRFLTEGGGGYIYPRRDVRHSSKGLKKTSSKLFVVQTFLCMH